MPCQPWRPCTVLPNRFYADILTLQKSIFSKPLKTTPRSTPIYPVDGLKWVGAKSKAKLAISKAKIAKLVCNRTNEFGSPLQSSFGQGNHPCAFPQVPKGFFLEICESQIKGQIKGQIGYTKGHKGQNWHFLEVMSLAHL